VLNFKLFLRNWQKILKGLLFSAALCRKYGGPASCKLLGPYNKILHLHVIIIIIRIQFVGRVKSTACVWTDLRVSTVLSMLKQRDCGKLDTFAINV